MTLCLTGDSRVQQAVVPTARTGWSQGEGIRVCVSFTAAVGRLALFMMSTSMARVAAATHAAEIDLFGSAAGVANEVNGLLRVGIAEPE